MYATYAHNTDIVYRMNTANLIAFMQLAVELIYLRYTEFFYVCI